MVVIISQAAVSGAFADAVQIFRCSRSIRDDQRLHGPPTPAVHVEHTCSPALLSWASRAIILCDQVGQVQALAGG